MSDHIMSRASALRMVAGDAVEGFQGRAWVLVADLPEDDRARLERGRAEDWVERIRNATRPAVAEPEGIESLRQRFEDSTGELAGKKRRSTLESGIEAAEKEIDEQAGADDADG